MEKLKELIMDADGKTLSHTKIWSNIAYLVVTYKFIVADVNADIWFVYLGVVGSATIASKYLSLRYNKK